jgi:hypothetical protein
VFIFNMSAVWVLSGASAGFGACGRLIDGMHTGCLLMLLFIVMAEKVYYLLPSGHCS